MRACLLVLCCILHGVEAGCVGQDCASPDSAEVLLTKKARFESSLGQISEENRNRLDLPTITKLTNEVGLRSLLELESAVQRMVDDTVNISANATGYERSYDPTTDDERLLETIRGYLAIVRQATKDAHANATRSLRANADQVAEVNREMTTRWAYVTQLGEQLDANRVSHRQCRTTEAVFKRNKDKWCGIFEKHRLQSMDESWEDITELWKKPHSDMTPGEKASLNEKIKKASDWFCGAPKATDCDCDKDSKTTLLQEKSVVNLAESYAAKHARAKSAAAAAMAAVAQTESVAASAAACTENTAHHESTRDSCKGNQTIFEAADCSWHTEHDEVCDWYNNAFGYEMEWIGNQRVIFANGEETRKAEHIAAKRVDCYLDVVVADQVNKSEMLRNCRNAIHSVDHLTLVFPTLQEKKYSCTIRGTASDDHTCGPNWLQTEYKSQPWFTDAPNEDCTACPTPAPTPAPTLPPTPAPTPEGPTTSDDYAYTFQLTGCPNRMATASIDYWKTQSEERAVGDMFNYCQHVSKGTGNNMEKETCCGEGRTDCTVSCVKQLVMSQAPCQVFGPSYGILNSGGTAAGAAWPINGVKSVGACSDLCMANSDCAVFHYYGYNEGSAYGACYLHKSGTASGQLDDGRDRYAGICKAPRTCEVFDSWRKNHLGKTVEIPLKHVQYGGVVSDWDECLELCRNSNACEQVVFQKDTKKCFGMNEASSVDQDTKGGSNTNYISAHCQAWAAQDYAYTFQLTGCRNPSTSAAAIDYWKTQSVGRALEDMFSYCQHVSSGTGSSTQKEMCCGTGVADCSVNCVQQLAMSEAPCDVFGPSESLSDSGGRSVGAAWPHFGVKSVGACSDLCMANSDCTAYHYYGYAESSASARGACYLQKSGKRSGQSDDGRDRYAGICKAQRTCEVFDNWRKKYLGAQVKIPLLSVQYGGAVADWDECLQLCRASHSCQQVVFEKSGNLCYGMNAASDDDEDGNGGSNDNYISAHCQAPLCDVEGPSYSIEDSGGRSDGAAWPAKVGSVAACSDLCVANSDCKVFHYYGQTDNQAGARGSCYLQKSGTRSKQLNDGRDRYAGICKQALPVCSDNIRYTTATTNTALCSEPKGHQIEYVGRECETGKIEWTSATSITRKAGLSSTQCSWDWTTHSGRQKYAGSCGVAPTVDGGSRLPTKCVQA